MALTYEESGALMADFAFRNRVKVAGLKYADSVMNEATTVPAHNARVRWATQMYQQPDQQAMLLQPPTVMDPAVQADGAAVTDSQLQAAVEGVINKLI